MFCYIVKNMCCKNDKSASTPSISMSVQHDLHHSHLMPVTWVVLLGYCMLCGVDYFALHEEPLHRHELQAPPLYPHVPTCQSAVIAILEEQYQAAEL